MPPESSVTCWASQYGAVKNKNIPLIFPGRKFDKNGEVIEKRTRWSEPAIKMFQEKAKCLVEQFSKYKVLNKFHVSKKQYYISFLASSLSRMVRANRRISTLRDKSCDQFPWHLKWQGVFLLPPGWDASPSQGYPQQ